MVKLKVSINPSNFYVKEDIFRFKNELLEQTSSSGKQILKENTPKETSSGANAYNVVKSENQHIIVNETEYLPWVNDGTGIYGPLRKRITPRTKQFLHFHWKGKEWYLKSVRGQKPQKFVEVSMIEIERDIPQSVMIASQVLK